MPTILPLHHPDIHDAANLITALRTDMNGRSVCTEAEMQEVLERCLEEKSYQGFIARDKSGIALGYIGVNRRFAIYAGGVFAQITELFVTPAARREGVASTLLATAEAHAKSVGASSIELGAPLEESHPGTHAFYESQGYRLSGPRLSKHLG